MLLDVLSFDVVVEICEYLSSRDQGQMAKASRLVLLIATQAGRLERQAERQADNLYYPTREEEPLSRPTSFTPGSSDALHMPRMSTGGLGQHARSVGHTRPLRHIFSTIGASSPPTSLQV